MPWIQDLLIVMFHKFNIFRYGLDGFYLFSLKAKLTQIGTVSLLRKIEI